MFLGICTRKIIMYCGRLKSEALIIIKEGTKIRHEDRQIRKDLQKFKKAREKLFLLAA